MGEVAHGALRWWIYREVGRSDCVKRMRFMTVLLRGTMQLMEIDQ